MKVGKIVDLKEVALKHEAKDKKRLSSKTNGPKNFKNGIYTMIYQVYSDYDVPVDHFGNFYSLGSYTVRDRVSPVFSELDGIFAHSVDTNRKVDKILEILGKR